MSLVNVGDLAACADRGEVEPARTQPAAATPAAAPAVPESPTYTRDVAPILFRHCSVCHHPGTNAAFSLLTYEDVRPRARLIAAATQSKYMPPWKPEPGFGDDFIGRRGLSN